MKKFLVAMMVLLGAVNANAECKGPRLTVNQALVGVATTAAAVRTLQKANAIDRVKMTQQVGQLGGDAIEKVRAYAEGKRKCLELDAKHTDALFMATKAVLDVVYSDDTLKVAFRDEMLNTFGKNAAIVLAGAGEYLRILVEYIKLGASQPANLSAPI